MRLSVLSLLLLLCYHASSFKFLMYNPIFGRSHVNFLGKLADALIDAGHEVTMISPIVDSSLGTFGSKKARIITVPQVAECEHIEKEVGPKTIGNVWKETSGPFAFVTAIGKLVRSMKFQCNATLHHPDVLPVLRKEKFDVAMSEIADFCGFGIFHMLGMDKVAVTFSLAAFDASFSFTGAPSFPSYVPGNLAGFSDKMTFLERVANTLPTLFAGYIYGVFVNPSDELFQELYGPTFPMMQELMDKTSLTFLNAEPLVAFPRVTTHKIIEVGGISISTGHKALNETWSAIFDLRPRTVLLSFGTVAKSYLMPDEYKASILEAFRKFPEVTFIWKYEQPEDRISEGLPNLIESTFVPQNDMLHDPRLSLFITHCGQGSTTEATTAGVPLIVIPVLGDQMANAQIIKRIGTGIILDKETLSTSATLEATITEVLGNPEYTEKAKKVGQMLRDTPFSARDKLVRNMEFLAKYGPLRQLDHYGTQLNFFQYYLIDVFAFLAAIALLSLFIVFFVLRALFRCVAKVVKVKKD